MSKMAIFAEGQTEVEFDSKLIEELATPRAITIETRKIRGGQTVPRTSQRIAIRQARNGRPSTHFFLLYDCGNDRLVKDRMLEEYSHLVSNGYSKIVCHRDVAPEVTYGDLARLEMGLPYRVPTKPVKVCFVLSVMEVEAWFLSEYLHFPFIDPAITLNAIRTNCGFDPSSDDLQLRPTPTADLVNCYALGGKKYDKENDRKYSQPTLDAIDYAHVAMGVSERFSYLATFCDEINSFLDS